MAGWTCAGCTTTYTVGAAKCPHCGSTERADEPGGSVLPSVTVACATDGCRFAGRERRVHLRTAAPGVLEMPPLICAGCGSHVLTSENTMAKITVHGGASNASLPDPGPHDDPGTSEPMHAFEAEAPDDVPGEESPEEAEPAYEDSTVEELKEQLGERGLPKTGSKADLVARLREDDASRAAGTE
ncbi:SAP domain-containing protein [Streptomyces sp. NPDC057257]|uniref:SAP domain-containing protein n=1 Tax=Streptomyces sp. NPDC057257 TaxID=3346071 RepID=UPI0036378DD0